MTIRPVACAVVLGISGLAGGAHAQVAADAEQPVAQPPRSAFAARFSAGFVTEWGVFPGSLLGATLSLRLGSQRFSGVLEAWTVFPTATAVSATGSANTFSFGGLAGACLEAPVGPASLTGCALGRAGALVVEASNAAVGPAGLQPTVAAGLRLGLAWPRDSVLAVVINTQGFVPIVRGHVEGEGYGWKQPWVFGGGQIGFQLRTQ